MTFRDEWTGFAGVFGGRVVAELVAAATRAAAATPAEDGAPAFVPVALFAEFSAAVDPGAAEVRADVVHAGRRTALVSVAVEQGRPRASGQVKLVRDSGGSVSSRRSMAGLPAPESLPAFETPYPQMAYSHLTDVRLIDHRTTHGQPTTRAWVRLRDGEPAVEELTPAGHAAVLLDVVPPGPFFSDPEVTFVPTVDFAMHRATNVEDADGWHLAEGSTEWWTGDFCAESTALWTADGRFVARGTQTRRVVRRV